MCHPDSHSQYQGVFASEIRLVQLCFSAHESAIERINFKIMLLFIYYVVFTINLNHSSAS